MSEREEIEQTKRYILAQREALERAAEAQRLAQTQPAATVPQKKRQRPPESDSQRASRLNEAAQREIESAELGFARQAFAQLQEDLRSEVRSAHYEWVQEGNRRLTLQPRHLLGEKPGDIKMVITTVMGGDQQVHFNMKVSKHAGVKKPGFFETDPNKIYGAYANWQTHTSRLNKYGDVIEATRHFMAEYNEHRKQRRNTTIGILAGGAFLIAVLARSCDSAHGAEIPQQEPPNDNQEIHLVLDR